MIINIGKNRMGKKSILLIASVIFMLLFCAGCAKQGIDGYWVKTEIIESDGTVLKGDDIGPYEAYTIEGDRAWYSTSAEVNGKEVGIELALVENKDGTYDFRVVIDGRVSDRLSLLKEVKFKGDTMSAEMNNGEQFVFKRQK